jgi:hypothetical protein
MVNKNNRFIRELKFLEEDFYNYNNFRGVQKAVLFRYFKEIDEWSPNGHCGTSTPMSLQPGRKKPKSYYVA